MARIGRAEVFTQLTVEGTMNDMGRDDWTTDDQLSEAQIRERLTAEGWEPVESLHLPATGVIEEASVSVPTQPVWSHSEQIEDEHVRIPAA
jgi:hypothetical protein